MSWDNGLAYNAMMTNALWGNGLWDNGLWNNALGFNGIWDNGTTLNGSPLGSKRPVAIRAGDRLEFAESVSAQVLDARSAYRWLLAHG